MRAYVSHTMNFVAWARTSGQFVAVLSVQIDFVRLDDKMIWVHASRESLATQMAGVVACRYVNTAQEQVHSPRSRRSLLAFAVMHPTQLHLRIAVRTSSEASDEAIGSFGRLLASGVKRCHATLKVLACAFCFPSHFLYKKLQQNKNKKKKKRASGMVTFC